MKPEDIGLATDGIVLGKHSGRHALAARAQGSAMCSRASSSTAPSPPSRTVADEVGIVDTARLRRAARRKRGRSGTQTLWKLSKVEIRAPVTANAWPVARVELDHGERGRVTDIASRAGRARRAPSPRSARSWACRRGSRALDMQYHRRRSGRDRRRTDRARTCWSRCTISVEGEIFAGRARARDILPSCVSAYIDAASNAEAVRDPCATRDRKQRSQAA